MIMGRNTAREPSSAGLGLATRVPPLQLVLDELSTAVAVLDAQGLAVVCNVAAARLFGGRDLPRLRREPALRKLLAGRGRDSTIWTSLGRSIQVRALPLDAMRLLEAVDIGDREQLSQSLATAQATASSLQEEHEELMCAYESLIIDTNETRHEVNDQTDLIEKLLCSNLELRAIGNGQLVEPAKLKARSAKGAR